MVLKKFLWVFLVLCVNMTYKIWGFLVTPAPLRRRPAREVCQVLGSPRVQDRHPLQGQQGAGLLPGRHGRCPRPATTSGRGRENERVRGLSG